MPQVHQAAGVAGVAVAAAVAAAVALVGRGIRVCRSNIHKYHTRRNYRSNGLCGRTTIVHSRDIRDTRNVSNTCANTCRPNRSNHNDRH